MACSMSSIKNARAGVGRGRATAKVVLACRCRCAEPAPLRGRLAVHRASTNPHAAAMLALIHSD